MLVNLAKISLLLTFLLAFVPYIKMVIFKTDQSSIELVPTCLEFPRV